MASRLASRLRERSVTAPIPHHSARGCISFQDRVSRMDMDLSEDVLRHELKELRDMLDGALSGDDEGRSRQHEQALFVQRRLY